MEGRGDLGGGAGARAVLTHGTEKPADDHPGIRRCVRATNASSCPTEVRGGACGRRAKSYAELIREQWAQGTVEYAITMVAMLSLVLGCAAVWRAGERGVFTQRAEAAASHALDAGGAVDIALY